MGKMLRTKIMRKVIFQKFVCNAAILSEYNCQKCLKFAFSALIITAYNSTREINLVAKNI